MPKLASTSGQPLYTIVVPAFEEATLIVDSLNKIHAFLKAEGLLDKTEVVVVTATSKDDTAKLVRSQQKLFKHFQFIEPGPRVGKGRDVKVGVLAAKGQYIVFTDADQATPTYHCKEAFKLLETGQADVVIGVRDLWTIHDDLLRKIISVVANWLVRLFLLPRIPDSQCGFKGFTRESANKLFSRLTILGWGFDMEILTIARKQKMTIKKIKIPDWVDPKIGMSLVGDSPLAMSIKTFGELFKIWLKRLKGAYR